MFLIYKSWFPELAYYESDEDRQKALRRATDKAVTITAIPSILLYTGVYIALRFLIAPLITRWTSLNSANLRLPSYVVAGAFAGIGGIWFARGRISHELRAQLIRFGVPICLGCGFDLRAAEVPRCPECGTMFDFADFDPARLERNAGLGGVVNSGAVRFQRPQRKKTRWSFMYTEIEIPRVLRVIYWWVFAALFAAMCVFMALRGR